MFTLCNYWRLEGKEEMFLKIFLQKYRILFLNTA